MENMVLNPLQLNQLDKIHNFMKTLLDHDQSGHDSSHIDRVVAMARKILKQEKGADEFVVLAAAALHDTYDEKLFANPASAKRRTADFLLSIQVDPKPILYIIDNMSWSANTFGQAKPLDLNGRIVQDADRLDAIGAVAVIRTFKYGFKHNRIDYDPNILPRDLQNKAEYRNDKQTTLNHFYEKLFKLQASLNTPAAKQIGQKRDHFMHEFVDEYIAEYESKA
ncbi:HD domain-containing protein [Oenococcus sp.]|uniref:HD domain-containing protein n=1 Tax=Oenococcus sp. TaxID=1979414 RepID=UPI0039E78067